MSFRTHSTVIKAGFAGTGNLNLGEVSNSRSRPTYTRNSGEGGSGGATYWAASSANDGTITYGGDTVVVDWDGTGTAPVLKRQLLTSSGTYYRLIGACSGTSQYTLKVISTTETGNSGSFTKYFRAAASLTDVEITIEAAGTIELQYFYADNDTGATTGTYCLDREAAYPTAQLVCVRDSSGEVAQINIYDMNTAPGLPEGLSSSVVSNSAKSFGRPTVLRPGHDDKYVDEGWWGIARANFWRIDDIWKRLRSENSNLSATVDPAAEWYVATEIDTPSKVYTVPTSSEIANGDYDESDAWKKECSTHEQYSVGAVEVPFWDGDWKRKHADWALFGRVPSETTSTYEYWTANRVNFDNEPNDFTVGGRGIILGAQQFVEVSDLADGETGTAGTPSFPGAIGKITVSGQDFVSATEYTANAGEANVDSSFAANVLQNGEWRAVTYVGEGGQDVDITTADLDTSSLEHWTFAGGTFAFIN